MHHVKRPNLRIVMVALYGAPAVAVATSTGLVQGLSGLTKQADLVELAQTTAVIYPREEVGELLRDDKSAKAPTKP